MIIPPFLKEGDEVGIITPSWEPDVNLVEVGIKKIKEAGFHPVLLRSSLGKRGTIAPFDVRLKEINNAFCSRNLKAVIFSRGGYGVMHLLPHINYQCLEKYPKWIIGYSDATALFMALEKKVDIAYIHGPMVESIGQGIEGTEELFKLLKGKLKEMPLYGELYNFKSVEGKITGGCLSLIISLMGTPFEPDFSDRIVLLEDVSEKDYRIDRMLTQLKLAGKLIKAKAFLIGGEENHTVYKDILSPLNKPLVIGFPAGHGRRNYPIVMNKDTILNKEKVLFN